MAALIQCLKLCRRDAADGVKESLLVDAVHKKGALNQGPRQSPGAFPPDHLCLAKPFKGPSEGTFTVVSSADHRAARLQIARASRCSRHKPSTSPLLPLWSAPRFTGCVAKNACSRASVVCLFMPSTSPGQGLQQNLHQFAPLPSKITAFPLVFWRSTHYMLLNSLRNNQIKCKRGLSEKL